MNAEVQPRQDVYSHERASLREHLEILAGRSTFREPAAGGSARWDSMPYEHTLSAALGMARSKDRRDDDPGPDILESLIYRRVVRGEFIIRCLVAALVDMSAVCARADPRLIRRLCIVTLMTCVDGIDRPAPALGKAQAGQWAKGSALAEILIWASAGQTLRRAADALG